MKIPDIQYDDINIPTSSDVSPLLTVDCLWDIYCVLKKVNGLCVDENRRVVEYLYAIGVNGTFVDEKCDALIVTGITNPKYKRGFPAAKYLFELEKYGFKIYNLETKSGESNRKKIKTKDIIKYCITYIENDFPNTMRGLKLFSDACFKLKGDPFFSADIRILYTGTKSKRYEPPIEDIISVLPKAEQNAALIIHKKLEELNCTRNLEREYMLRYTHPNKKSQTFATIYLKNQFWFPDYGNGQELSIKLNLRHIDKYTDYLEMCTEPIQQAVINTAPCYGCNKHCGGIQFTFKGKKYVKCPSHIFRFVDISDQSIDNYINLLDMESKCLEK